MVRVCESIFEGSTYRVREKITKSVDFNSKAGVVMNILEGSLWEKVGSLMCEIEDVITVRVESSCLGD